MFQIANWLGAAEKDKGLCPFNVRSRQREEHVAGAPSGCSADKERPNRRDIEGEPNAEDRFAEMPRYASVTVSRLPPPQTHFFLFGRGNDDRSRWTVLRYDPHRQRAERVADMESRRLATFSVVGADAFYPFFVHCYTCHGKESVFVVGGRTPRQDLCSKRVSEFLVKEARWRERSPLAVGRRSHAAAVVKTAGGGEGMTLLGVFGGENE
ncbi:unnamed protein product, partial [Schistocephalus solidus]|uniref:Uncharacterized protein n=1 Tax=Schistocephalus solidus TaxID=70667 RepID=A0A183TUR6_SCHSO